MWLLSDKFNYSLSTKYEHYVQNRSANHSISNLVVSNLNISDLDFLAALSENNLPMFRLNAPVIIRSKLIPSICAAANWEATVRWSMYLADYVGIKHQLRSCSWYQHSPDSNAGKPLPTYAMYACLCCSSSTHTLLCITSSSTVDPTSSRRVKAVCTEIFGSFGVGPSQFSTYYSA